MWLAMNVRPLPGTTRFVFRIDIPSVREMMNDYFARDYWPVVEHPSPGCQTHLIAGGKSEVVDAADRDHAMRCPDGTMDVIEDVGHWVHVDAPEALLRLVVGYL
jgi:pimeloyl-ACP methyl ester carboxylesterase